MAGNLGDARIHDLQHSFASIAAGAGLSLPVIGKLLGHSQPATTARYAHLAPDPIRAASNLIGSAITAAMKGPADRARPQLGEDSRCPAFSERIFEESCDRTLAPPKNIGLT
jgi:hypothetical protein